jgi:hypothetical protein
LFTIHACSYNVIARSILIFQGDEAIQYLHKRTWIATLSPPQRICPAAADFARDDGHNVNCNNYDPGIEKIAAMM